LTIGN